jgi:hypothetical protein
MDMLRQFANAEPPRARLAYAPDYIDFHTVDPVIRRCTVHELHKLCKQPVQDQAAWLRELSGARAPRRMTVAP